ncbi:DUF4440 domain-containing protein [Streptomyces sp. NBC_00442]|uniref:DUF4440 domain-containing protein n=1 Tax=Streptomyces sp. NBC_00442 TaxID=2903651 RepID=UPI002E24182F
MTEREAFLAWVDTELHDAEIALHNGDPGPRRALWSREEPVSVLGAWRNVFRQEAVGELFVQLAARLSDCTSLVFDLRSCDVVGDMAYTAGFEHISVTMDGHTARVHTAGDPGVPPRERRVAGRPPAR